MVPIVALIGQNNVGKSTLFNRLTKTHNALVADYPGLTRDRQYGFAWYKEYKFIVVDTGGFNINVNTGIQSDINNQSIVAIRESDLVLFVVDVQSKKSSINYNIIDFLRREESNFIVIVNKADNFYFYENKKVLDYHFLGIKQIFPISAVHGYGINNLLSNIFLNNLNFSLGVKRNRNPCVEIISNTNFFYNDRMKLSYNKQLDCITVAIVGSPNVGKSTLINRVLKKNRMIICNNPRTTRDSISIPVIYNDKKYILIDTAGVMNNNRISDLAEKISVAKTLQSIKNSDLVLFMMDINTEIPDRELSLLRFIINYGKSLVIAVNKWDGESIKLRNKIKNLLCYKVSFIDFIQIHFISALYGFGIESLFKSFQKTFFSSFQIFKTSYLNNILHEAVIQFPPPLFLCKNLKKSIKLKFIHVKSYRPVVFIIYGTQVSNLPANYRSYLKNFFYRALNIKGVLLHFQFRNIKNPFVCK